MADGSLIAARDLVLPPVQIVPPAFVPLNLQRPKRTTADTHRGAVAACLECSAFSYMGECATCDRGWTVAGAVCSMVRVPVDGSSGAVAKTVRERKAQVIMISPVPALPTMRVTLNLYSGDYYAVQGVVLCASGWTRPGPTCLCPRAMATPQMVSRMCRRSIRRNCTRASSCRSALLAS